MHRRIVSTAIAVAWLALFFGCAEPATVGTAAQSVEVDEVMPADCDPDDKECIPPEDESKTAPTCGFVCRPDQHSEGVVHSDACGSGLYDNAAICVANTGPRFWACGSSCPTGYHVTDYGRSTLDCADSNLVTLPPYRDQSVCEENVGPSFAVCGSTCPTGYAVVGRGHDSDCNWYGVGLEINSATCRRLLQGDLTGDGYYAMGAGESLAVTIAWTTEYATSASLRVITTGQAEQVLSTSLSGSTVLTLHAGETIALALYGNGVLLDTGTLVAPIMTGSISATPQYVQVIGATGSTTIAWTTTNVGSQARVFVSMDGGPRQWFTNGASGQTPASWIQAGHAYRFTLHSDRVDTAPVLAEVTVYGQAAAPAIDPAPGSWWNAARSGNGMDFRVAGDLLYFTWLTYTATGSPTWYLSTLDRLPGRWSGNVTRYTWNGVHAVPAVVGTATLTLTSSTAGTLAYTVDGRSATEPVKQFVFGSGLSVPSLSGLWYDPNQSGWGVDFDTQGSTHFTYVMAYSGGQPTWVTGTATGSGQLSFGLVRTVGTNLCPGCVGTPSYTTSSAGSLTVDATNPAGPLPTTLTWSLWPRSIALHKLL